MSEGLLEGHASTIRPTTAIRRTGAIQPRTAAAMIPVTPATRPITAIRNTRTVRERAPGATRRRASILAAQAEIMDAGSRNGDGGTSAEAPLDTAVEEQAWDEAMHQALSLAKAQGKSPGAVEETIRGAQASVLDWRTLLRRYMTGAEGDRVATS